MKNYKAIILGPQCSGKTTLKKYLLEEYGKLPLLEEDEIFTDLNNGVYPEDVKHKENTLRPQLIDKVSHSDNLIFLTSYCSISLLIELKLKGFKVIQLLLERDEFNRRNDKRMKEEEYEDARTWAEHIFKFHQKVREQNLIHFEVDANQPIENVAKEIIDFLRAGID